MKKAIRELPWAAAGGSIAVGVGLLAMGVLIATAGRGEPLPRASTAAGATLATVERLAGGGPERCVYAAPGRELCRWEIEGRLVEPRGAEPAATRLVLVCELPAEGGQEPAAAGSCFIGTLAGDAWLPPVSAGPDVSERARQAATRALAAARDVTSLSRLVGDAPETCQTLWGGQLCRWGLRLERLASPDLALLTEGQGDKELRCLLPLAGGRADGSCAVLVVD